MDKKKKPEEHTESFEIDYEDDDLDNEDYLSVNDVAYEQKSKQKRKHSNRNYYYGD